MPFRFDTGKMKFSLKILTESAEIDSRRKTHVLPPSPFVMLKRSMALGTEYCYPGVPLALLKSLTQGACVMVLP